MLRLIASICLVGLALASLPTQDAYRKFIKEGPFAESNPLLPAFGPDPIKLKIGFILLNINKFSLKKEEIEASLFTTLEWKDTTKSWDPESYGGVSQFYVPLYKDHWGPDIFHFNNVDGGTNGFLGDDDIQALVMADGTHVYVPTHTHRASCKIQFDATGAVSKNQTCKFIFGSWVHHAGEIDHEAGDVDTEFLAENTCWELVKAEAIRNRKEYKCCPGVEFDDVTLELNLRFRGESMFCNLPKIDD